MSARKYSRKITGYIRRDSILPTGNESPSESDMLGRDTTARTGHSGVSSQEFLAKLFRCVEIEIGCMLEIFFSELSHDPCLSRLVYSLNDERLASVTLLPFDESGHYLPFNLHVDFAF